MASPIHGLRITIVPDDRDVDRSARYRPARSLACGPGRSITSPADDRLQVRPTGATEQGALDPASRYRGPQKPPAPLAHLGSVLAIPSIHSRHLFFGERPEVGAEHQEAPGRVPDVDQRPGPSAEVSEAGPANRRIDIVPSRSPVSVHAGPVRHEALGSTEGPPAVLAGTRIGSGAGPACGIRCPRGRRLLGDRRRWLQH